MKKLVFIFFLFVCVLVQGQSNGVIEKQKKVYAYLEESHAYAVSAFNNANTSYKHISKCYESSSIEDMQYYAKKAKSIIFDIQDNLSNAESSASDAETEANKIKCSGAESDADDAGDAFTSSKNEFSEVERYLKKIMIEEDMDFIESYLKKVLNYFEDGILYMKTGMDEINDAVDCLNKCK